MCTSNTQPTHSDSELIPSPPSFPPTPHLLHGGPQLLQLQLELIGFLLGLEGQVVLLIPLTLFVLVQASYLLQLCLKGLDLLRLVCDSLGGGMGWGSEGLTYKNTYSIVLSKCPWALG